MKSSAWLGVVVAVAATVVLIEEKRIAKLREQIAAGLPGAVTGAGDQTASPTRPAEGHAPRSMPVRPTRTERGQPERAKETTTAAEPAGDSLQKSLRKMAENPAGRAMMNQGVRAMAGVWYAGLIKQFELDDKERDYFLDLIGGGFGRQQELGMKMATAKDAAERQAIADELKTAETEKNDAIKEFLNDDEDYARFSAWQERLPERQQLDGLRAVMKEAKAALDPAQEEKVIEAMYRARTTLPAGSDWQGAAGMEKIAGGNAAAQFEEQWAQASAHTVAEVGKVLEGEQLEAFRRYQEQLKEMQLMGIRMAEKMFRPDEAGTAKP